MTYIAKATSSRFARVASNSAGVGARGQRDIDDRTHVAAQRPRVSRRAPYPRNDTRLLEPANTVGHRTGSEVHVIGKSAPADSTIRLEDPDDSSVDTVKGRCFREHVHRMPGKRPLINGSDEPKMAPMIMTEGVPKQI